MGRREAGALRKTRCRSGSVEVVDYRNVELAVPALWRRGAAKAAYDPANVLSFLNLVTPC